MAAPKGNKNAVGNKGGQPTKLNQVWLDAAEKVVLNESFILFTDEELVDEINDQLELEYRIHQNTFGNWKKKFRDGDFDQIDPVGIEFLCLLKKAIRKQKELLFNTFKIDEKWQRWAWIIERKFGEWNLVKKSESERNITGKIDVVATTKTIDVGTMTDDDLDKLIELQDKYAEKK